MLLAGTEAGRGAKPQVSVLRVFVSVQAAENPGLLASYTARLYADPQEFLRTHHRARVMAGRAGAAAAVTDMVLLNRCWKLPVHCGT